MTIVAGGARAQDRSSEADVSVDIDVWLGILPGGYINFIVYKSM